MLLERDLSDSRHAVPQNIADDYCAVKVQLVFATILAIPFLAFFKKNWIIQTKSTIFHGCVIIIIRVTQPSNSFGSEHDWQQ